MVDDMKLELVQILFRHGARTCIKMEVALLPDHIDQSLHETYGYEQLTKYGKAQMYKLGRALRARYDDFLGPNYHPKYVCARSTDFDRTKMSLQLVLAGLYPPSAEQSFSNGLNWLPVPFSVVPKELDVLLLMSEKKRYKDILECTALTSNADNGESAEASKVRQFLEDKAANAFNQSNTIRAALYYYNVLNTHKTAKCPLPDWYTDDIYDALQKRVISYLDMMSSTIELKKTLSGLLIKKVVENMDVNDKMISPRKIYLYSGHEFNVAAFLRAHEIEEMKYPDFGSAVVVEKLRDSKGRLHVRMLAWTGKDDHFFTLKLNKRDEICPINEYIDIIENVVPCNEELGAVYKECSVDFEKINETDPVFKDGFFL